MNRTRVLAVARKEAIQIRRDPRSLGMAFVIPMLLLFLYGFALSLDVDRLGTIVYDQDRSLTSRDFVERFTESRYFAHLASAESYRDVERALVYGTAQVALVIPPNFGRDIDRGRPVAVQALLDGSDSNTATLALAYLEAITSRYAGAVATERTSRPIVTLEHRLRVWYNAELRSRNYIVPGLIAVIMMVLSALLTSMTIAREWERGTMEQLISTPLRASELIVGKLLPYVVIGLIDVAVSAAMGTLVLGVPLRGSLVLLFGLTLIFLLGTQGLGLLISIRAKSQVVASQAALTMTFLPAFLLSGFVFDIDSLPAWLRAVTYLVPARYFVSIVKGIFLKGVGATVLAAQIVFLTAFAILVTVAAHRAFRKNLE